MVRVRPITSRDALNTTLGLSFEFPQDQALFPKVFSDSQTWRVAMAALATKFKPGNLSPDHLLLDPNNPRYQGDFQDFVFVPYEQISEPLHQTRAMARLLEERFGVRQLAESIAEVGYLPIDNLVVSPYSKEKYLVIEGNRRLAAIRLILSGKVLATPENKSSLNLLPVLILDEPPEMATIEQWLIQGTRHVGGVKPWGPYQKARAIEILNREKGLSYEDAAAALGMKPGELRRSLQALGAFKELMESPRFGRRARVEMFSFFEELVRKPALRSYFGWNNGEMRFDSPDKRDLLFRLIMGEGGKHPKVGTGLEFRELAKVLDVSEARSSLEDLNQPLQRAFDLASARERGAWFSDLLVRLEQTTEDILQVPEIAPTSRQRAIIKDVISKLKIFLKRR